MPAACTTFSSQKMMQKTPVSITSATTARGCWALEDTVIETRWTDTHDGPMPMPDGSVIAPTDIEHGPNPACVIYRIEDDKIAEIRHYFDMAGPMAKITAAAG